MSNDAQVVLELHMANGQMANGQTISPPIRLRLTLQEGDTFLTEEMLRNGMLRLSVTCTQIIIPEPEQLSPAIAISDKLYDIITVLDLQNPGLRQQLTALLNEDI